MPGFIKLMPWKLRNSEIKTIDCCTLPFKLITWIFYDSQKDTLVQIILKDIILIDFFPEQSLWVCQRRVETGKGKPLLGPKWKVKAKPKLLIVLSIEIAFKTISGYYHSKPCRHFHEGSKIKEHILTCRGPSQRRCLSRTIGLHST